MSLGGMRCSLNIPGHLIIAMKKLIKLPLTKKEKTTTSDNYISNHFPDTTLLCLLIVQKHESREMPQTNLMGLIRNNSSGSTLSLFFCIETMHVLKKTTVNTRSTNSPDQMLQ